MASASTRVQTTDERSLIPSMIAAILDRLSIHEREQISAWLSMIEEHAEKLILGLGRKTKSKRKPEILTAAALYDAFLEFEDRTHVRCRLPMMKATFGLSPCSINTAWTLLFDNRAVLRRDYLNPVYFNDNGTYDEAVDAVLENIINAVVNLTQEVRRYASDIRDQACEFLEKIDCAKAEEYDPLLVGTAVIYAAICSHHGKPRIQVSQRDLSQFCSCSPSMLSKVWLKLFASSTYVN